MKRIVLFALTILGTHLPAYALGEAVSVQIPGMRFYAVRVLDHSPEGRVHLLAAGQIDRKGGHDALIVAFSAAGGAIKEIGRETFRVGPAGDDCGTRIRSMVCRKDPGTNRMLVIVNGKAGPKDREAGFIRSYLYDGAFEPRDTLEFSDPGKPYTHGYPLTLADIDGDGRDEAVYGGFSGEDDRDHADIRVFSTGERGALVPLEKFANKRLNDLPLRINALTSGDFNGDGFSEVAAAGRTVEKDVERAAFAVITEKTSMWKQVNDLGQCRYRYATAADIDEDGRLELVLGGRIDLERSSYALLDVWKSVEGDMRLFSRYRFSGAGSARLRAVEPLPGVAGRLVIGGRMEVLDKDRLRWKGFVQGMMWEAGTLFPCTKPTILDKDWETRVRAMAVVPGALIAAGFTEDERKASTGFISLLTLH